MRPANSAQPQRSSAPEPLRHYGYLWAESLSYGPHLSEVHAYTNLNAVQRPEDLAVCAKLEVQCILEARWQFFQSSMPDGRLPLTEHHELLWQQLRSAITEHIRFVAAFYVVDEPYWGGVSQADLERSIAIIKASFPDKPVIVNFARPSLTAELQVPRQADWIGFDHYGPINEVERLLAVLMQRIHPHQRVFLVPQSFRNATAKTDTALAHLNREYYELARATPRVIGLLNFGLWTHEKPQQVPLTLAEQRRIGTLVTGR